MMKLSEQDQALIQLGREFENLQSLKQLVDNATEEYGQALDAFEERYGRKKRERLEELLM
jgi:hypothetical protein